MRKFTIGEEADAAAELERLLEYNGYSFRRKGDSFRLLFSDRGRKWETVCVCREQAVMVYGIFPFLPGDRGKALSAANELNSQLLRGGIFLTEDAVVFRTCADLFDAYSAYESIARAMEYNANVVYSFWRRMADCADDISAANPTLSG